MIIKLGEPLQLRQRRPSLLAKIVAATASPVNRTAFFASLREPRPGIQIRIAREYGHHPDNVVELSHEIELDISTNPEIAGTRRVA